MEATRRRLKPGDRVLILGGGANYGSGPKGPLALQTGDVGTVINQPWPQNFWYFVRGLDEGVCNKFDEADLKKLSEEEFLVRSVISQ